MNVAEAKHICLNISVHSVHQCPCVHTWPLAGNTSMEPCRSRGGYICEKIIKGKSLSFWQRCSSPLFILYHIYSYAENRRQSKFSSIELGLWSEANQLRPAKTRRRIRRISSRISYSSRRIANSRANSSTIFYSSTLLESAHNWKVIVL